jgi:hypothetical protein
MKGRDWAGGVKSVRGSVHREWAKVEKWRKIDY